MLGRPRAERSLEFRPRRLDEVEREHARRALEHFKGDRAKAADALGIEPGRLDALAGGG